MTRRGRNSDIVNHGMQLPERTSDSRHMVLVWDAATRLFHWLVTLFVAAAYVTWQLNWMDFHAWVGKGLLGLLLFRLLWGFFGSETARFSSFVVSPRRAARYLASAFRRSIDREVGHNPAGGWMVLLLLTLLFGESLTGLYVANDVADVGPLTEITPAGLANAITVLHRLLWNALLVAIALHLLAILIYALAKGHNLVLPMLTGKKSLPMDVPQPQMADSARALFFLLLSGFAAAAIAHFL